VEENDSFVMLLFIEAFNQQVTYIVCYKCNGEKIKTGKADKGGRKV
jgi:hypothetical protein